MVCLLKMNSVFHCLISSYYELVTQCTKLIIPEFFQQKVKADEYFQGHHPFPFLKEGSKYALFQSSGTSSVLHEFSKLISSGSVMTSANSLSTLGCQPWGPVDLNISGLLKFSFTHSSPRPAWIPAPVFKSYLSLSGYYVDF